MDSDLTYRDLRADDTDALHAIVSDWRVTRQLGSWPWPAVRDFTKSRCTTYGGRGFVWGIFTKNQLVGTVGVSEGDLGYCLAPPAWGQGIASRAAQFAIDHAFRDPSLLCISASVWDDNVGSPRVLAKSGFEYVETTTMHALARDAQTLCHHYSLERAAWHRLRTCAQ